jgi:hypothetical protein
MLAIAIVSITSALAFYTAAVFWEKRTGTLRGKHLLLFWLGHALWATVVHASRKSAPKEDFHRYSVAVWAVWLFPYLSGLAFGAGIGR